jgi:hypothetical protein
LSAPRARKVCEKFHVFPAGAEIKGSRKIRAQTMGERQFKNCPDNRQPVSIWDTRQKTAGKRNRKTAGLVVLPGYSRLNALNNRFGSGIVNATSQFGSWLQRAISGQKL